MYPSLKCTPVLKVCDSSVLPPLVSYVRALPPSPPDPQALSVYGYSLTPFLGAAPVCLFSWPLRSAGLATASLVAAIFVLRSAWPRLQEHMPEKSMVLLLAAVATYHVLWFLLLTVV